MDEAHIHSLWDPMPQGFSETLEARVISVVRDIIRAAFDPPDQILVALILEHFLVRLIQRQPQRPEDRQGPPGHEARSAAKLCPPAPPTSPTSRWYAPNSRRSSEKATARWADTRCSAIASGLDTITLQDCAPDLCHA